MTFAQGLGLLFATLFLAVSSVTATSLLLRARQTRRRPELMMGLGLAGTGAFGFGMSLLAELVEASYPGLAASLRVAGILAVSLASVAFATFTQQVFRAGKVWARLFVAIASVAFTGLFAVTLVDHWQLGPDRTDPSMLARAVVLSSVWAWMGFECVRYRSVLRRRLALGLADPIVVNRFTLWAFVSVESVVLNSTVTLLSFAAGGSAMNTDAMVITTGGLGMAGSIAIWLAFMPPRAYERWIVERSARSARSRRSPSSVETAGR